MLSRFTLRKCSADLRCVNTGIPFLPVLTTHKSVVMLSTKDTAMRLLTLSFITVATGAVGWCVISSMSVLSAELQDRSHRIALGAMCVSVLTWMGLVLLMLVDALYRRAAKRRRFRPVRFFHRN